MARRENPNLTRRIIDLAQYVGVRTVSGFMQCFDVEQNLHTARALGSLYCRISNRHRERAIDNLSFAYPDWPRARIENIAEQSIQHMLGLMVVDAMVMPRLVTPESWPTFLRLSNFSSLIDKLIRREPTINITAHFGNWELLGYAMAVIGYPVNAVARPLDNPLINRWLLGIREARGMRIITKWGAATIVQDILRSGGRISFTADQNAGDQGMFVPFFGRLASSYKSIGLLAVRNNVPIVVGSAVRLPGNRFKYELECSDVIETEEWVDQPDPLFYVVARFNRAMETMIRKTPEQYLWMHRRWRSRPRHERMGKPMPERLIDKLRSLPWMTEAELQRIIAHSNESAAKHAAGTAA